MANDATGQPGQSRHIQLDARNLRGIAHPLRVRILTLLREEGPANATSLAHRLGLNTGATSYHLRQLAMHGFVVEDPTRGTGRQRWWRAAHWGTVLDRSVVGQDDEGLGWVYLRAIAEQHAENTLRAVDALATQPEPWQRATSLNDYSLRLTPDELRRLRKEIAQVVTRYRSADPATAAPAPPGAAEVTVQFQAFPRPGTEPPVAGAG